MCVGVESGVRFSFDSGSESCDSSSLLGVIACHVYACATCVVSYYAMGLVLVFALGLPTCFMF